MAPLLYGRPSEKVEPKLRDFGNFLSLENQPYQFWGDQSSKSPRTDAAGELFRNIVRMAEGPLNPPILGDFEDMPPQNWGLGGLKDPSLRCQYFQVLN